MKRTRMRVGPVAEAILRTVAVAGVVTVAVCAPNALQILKPFSIKRNIPLNVLSRKILNH